MADRPGWGDADAARARDVVGDGLAQLRHAGGRAVVRVTVMKCVNCGLDDVFWSIKIGLANFQMDDVLALSFEGAGAHPGDGDGRGLPQRDDGRLKRDPHRRGVFRACSGCASEENCDHD